MHAFLIDLALAVRSLRRSRGFVVITVVSLGIALGITTTIFGVVDAALNPVVPVRDPARVVLVTNGGDGAGGGASSFDKLEAARRATDLFEAVSFVAPGFSFFRVGERHDRQIVLEVSTTFFDVTGIQPFLGSTVDTDQGAGDTTPTAMVSFQVWRSALGGRRDFSSATVEIEGTVYRVVGVLPSYMPAWLNAGVIIPMAGDGSPTATSVRLVGRLASGVEAVQAESTLRTVVDPALTATFGVGRQPFRFRVHAIAPERPDEMSDLQRILLASAFLILVIACANMANLMIARGLARQRDYALCLALGARRGNLIRQTLLEGLLCALAGAALGILIATWAFDLATYRMTREVPGLGAMAVSLNWRVFAFTVLAASGTSVAFAIIPAIRMSNVNLDLPLKSGAGTTTGRSRSRFSVLVVMEVALTMTLMLGAGLLMKAVQSMRATELGYNPRGLLSIDTYMARTTPFGRRGAVSSDEISRLVATVRHQPGVIGAAAEGIAMTPRHGPGLVSALASGGNRRLFAQNYTVVSPDYLRTLGASIIQGRDFGVGDAEGRGAIILNEAAATALWRSESPVGQLLKLGDLETDAPWLPVVGVSRNMRQLSTVMSAGESRPAIWVVPPRTGLGSLHRVTVRVAPGHETEARTALVRIARQTLPPGSVVAVSAVVDSFDYAVLARDFLAKLFVVFGALALALAAIGLYCLLTFTVAERRREFAVRRALGATGRQVGNLVLHDAGVMVLAGTGTGAFLAMWLARALDALLYDVFYTDVGALIVAEVSVLVVSLIACIVPTWRAAKCEPVDVLRAS
jgi:putative ABC transport system permease protein